MNRVSPAYGVVLLLVFFFLQSVAADDEPFLDLGDTDFTFSAWISTRHDGTLFARCLPDGEWIEDSKALFLQRGRLAFDVGWVGCVHGTARVNDGRWHHVAFVAEGRELRFYVDGRLDAMDSLERPADPPRTILKLGACTEDFPEQEDRQFRGRLDEVGFLTAALGAEEIEQLARGEKPRAAPLAHWSMDETLADKGGRFPLQVVGSLGFAEGRHGRAITIDGDHLVLPGSEVTLPRAGDSFAATAARDLEMLRRAVEGVYSGTSKGTVLSLIDSLRQETVAWETAAPKAADHDRWMSRLAALRRRMLLDENPLLDCRELLFVKRQTYHSSHFYTDFIDGVGRYGGNVCVLDLATGDVTDLLPTLSGGIFGRIDLSFDAERIVFDWKKSPREGFRIFECNVDGSGLKQLTSRPDDEDRRIALYDNHENGGTARMYFHQTDDMHPCYLPDGGIVFTSTRCQYGTLCDAPDHLTTTVLHRIDGDGSNMERLTNSAVSEFSPSIMEDGWILYTRWEYVDKGQLGIKCLWAVRPDGTGSREIYGNDIQFPPTMLHGRQIPGLPNQFVMLGTPHYPQSGIGTVVRVDTTRSIRTREPMTYVTPHVDIRQESGWNHYVAPVQLASGDRHAAPRYPSPDEEGRWTKHTRGPLYMDPYPLSKDVFLVSHNPDRPWDDPTAYGLYVIDTWGNHARIHDDEDFSCWQPIPLRPRKLPPVQPRQGDPALAAQNLAVCVVQDVHHGMAGVEPGEIRWIRIMEQLPRPWSARRRWEPAANHTGLVSAGPALAAKVLHGVVRVEGDGSAHFLVPADRNIYLQALDENFMEVQRERTYVNYRPGEYRACIGCHETPDEAPTMDLSAAKALARPPSAPVPQPGDRTAARPLHYPTDVQPVLDHHCTRCHGGSQPADGLDLTGEMTKSFCRSYENLLGRGCVATFDEGSDWGGTAYAPPRTVGSHASRLISQIRRGCPGNTEVLPREDFVKIATWVDANAVYYGSYWGRIHIAHRDHPHFRPVPTFQQATSTDNPFSDEE